MSFATLGLSIPLLSTITRKNYTHPYPVQEQAIPAILAGKDVLGVSKTGSGKTASYALPIIERFQQRTERSERFPPALVLVPTRELAIQVAEVFTDLSEHLPQQIKASAVYGGVSINPQMKNLRHTDVLVATPGRLLDLVESKTLHLNKVEILVLDEADKMLNKDFREEMDKILAQLPVRRQTILFSATLNPDIKWLQEHLLFEPVTIEIKETEDAIDTIEQTAYHVSMERKGPFLRYLIKEQNIQQVLVFASSTRTADNIVAKLNKNGIQAAAFHGDMGQNTRIDILHQFKSGKIRVLVASDLAARGIDIVELPVVINYELPRSPKDYIHRIGRTGRAGAMGKAITLVTPEDDHHFGIIQKKMGRKVAITETDTVNLQGY
ncbi:ATP-dependent RNA helicase RhlE [Chitinophaga costaii]|uniref:ATP-dependent RNA helicase RhlE n=1 Tax=Chitinophaga costaii TaxID=1335309 RepID=A0A1C4EZK2_9BACT|nr:DEAD/DEAH box helicase [Chitinophaga costaii]PUZ21528.1 ATP-dependent helicase [Chitinophaga costaii]SCC48913.1 ATP-dependent RNA helicase RhlE [Chitinophaga costaii]